MPGACRSFICCECAKSFKNEKALKFHQRQVHSSSLSGTENGDMLIVDAVDRVDDMVNIRWEDEMSLHRCMNDFVERKVEALGKSSENAVMSVNRVNRESERSVGAEKCKRRLLTLCKKSLNGVTNEQFCRWIADANGMVAVCVAGDGSCQYEAVIAGLNATTYGVPLDVKMLRKGVADEIMMNRGQYESFIADVSLERYVEGVLRDQWGDEITLKALSVVLGIHITVYQFSDGSQNIYDVGEDESEFCVYLTLDNRNDLSAHYGALICCDDAAVRVDCEGMSVTSSIESELSDSLQSDDSSISSVIEGRSRRRSKRRKEARNANGNALFKIPGIPSVMGEQCRRCGGYFKCLKRHKKCTESLLREGRDVEDAESMLKASNEEIAVDGENMSETSSIVSDLSDSIESDDSSRSSVFDGCGSRRSLRKKEKHITNENAVFKIPGVPSVIGEQCRRCGGYFKCLKRHKKCTESLLREGRDVENAESAQTLRNVTFSSVMNVDNNKEVASLTGNVISERSGGRYAVREVRDERMSESSSVEDSDVETDETGSRNYISRYGRRIGKRYTRFGSTCETDLKLTWEQKLAMLKKEFRPWRKDEMDTDDVNYHELKSYHDYLSKTLDDVATLKLTPEVQEVIDVKEWKERMKLDGDSRVPYSWSKVEEEKLNELSALAKCLKPPRWPWNAPDDSRQGKYNHKRMQVLVKEELKYRILRCPQCGVTALLVGPDQIDSEVCIDCLKLNRKRPETRKVYDEAWCKVKPAEEVSKCVFRTNRGDGSEIVKDLPCLNPAEEAVLALVQPIVTVKRNFIANRQYKQECINLLHNPARTWCKVLPRKNLGDRFVVIERRFKNSSTRYMIADPVKVRMWLKHLVKNHSVYIRKMANRELEISEDALVELERQSELASVDYDSSCEDGEESVDVTENPPPSAELDAGLSKTELFAFEQSDYLYLKKQHALKVTESGKIEVIKDDEGSRQALYDPHISANVAFPHLYPNGEMAPMDCGRHWLARHLLKKQSQFAQRTQDGRLQWSHGEHSVHMMHQYARLVEMHIRAITSWYISVRPETANVPLECLLDAFREGINNDQGAIDSQMPELQGIMAQIRNSREKWFAERQGIEAVSRDLGDANLFFTLNCDPRAWPDVRKLLFELSEGVGKEMPPDYYEIDTDKFTKLLDRYASQVAIYLNKKVKLFIRAFLCDICRIPKAESGRDVTDPIDRMEHGWFWSRVEWTQTRGVQHWHCIAKLPGVLDTAILSRMVQNMRVVREELKFGNIKDYEKAWRIIKCGLLASRYLVLFANSISTCSFFRRDMDNEQFDESEVIDLDEIRKVFVEKYVKKEINKKTHPIMRQFDDEDCDENVNVEMANVAAVSCMHNCIAKVCGGDEKTSKGCRFDFPKKKVKYTVPMLMEVHENQMELQMLMRRTNERIPNLQKYFLRYYRANHDFTVLVDAAHKMRYAAKYVSKGGNITVLLNEIIEHLQQKASSIVPPTIKQALTELVLAECSHRTYISKQELAYKVMDLPQIRRNFAQVKTVAHYPRAVVVEENANTESGVVELTDRTEYSAYSERCRANTMTSVNLTMEELTGMNLREFSESVGFRWVLNRDGSLSEAENGTDSKRSYGEGDNDDCDIGSHHANETDVECDDVPTENSETGGGEGRKKGGVKWRCRDRRSGHWLMWRRRKAIHIKPSTLLYTEPARYYVPVDGVKRFFDLPTEKRNQLKRAYQEIVCYVPWQDDPDKTFLSAEMIKELSENGNDPDAGCRYNLRRLDMYFRVYMKMWNEGKVARPGTQWHRDNQYSFTMYLATQHNRVIHDDRVANGGVLIGRYDGVEDVEGGEVLIQARLASAGDDDEYPSAVNYVPYDIFEEIERQNPPNLSEINVAYPHHALWKEMKSRVTQTSDNLFMANPPMPEVDLSELTPMQRHAYDLIVEGRERIVYIYGKAGTGKTVVAQHICERFRGRVQAAAGTGKAASNFNGPTIHGAFMWAAKNASFGSAMSTAKKQRLQNFYRNTDVFIFDEINACSAEILCQIDETMKELFCAVNPKTGKRIDKPFGGKSVVFMGDSAQLRPIRGAAIYDSCVNSKVMLYKSAGAKSYFRNAQKGQEIYRQYLVPKCIWLQQGQRNSGLLQQIMDNLRDGKHTESDLDKLLYQRQKYPDFMARRGIHYSNESASIFNCRQLWDDCRSMDRRLHICRAVYHVDDDNEYVVKTLSAVPASEFGYAPDVLCLAEGCEVRLISNLDTSAGLVTNATGRVVQIVYDNADADELSKGKYPPAYCVIVYFPGFQGFVTKSSDNERYFPFSNRKLVPIYRRQFFMEKLPENIRKVQARRLCYREQLPIDLCSNLTAHRGQGQSWKNSTLSVSLGFESPQNKLPPDAASIAYVACTRITRLKDLFVSPIFPSVWLDMGKSDRDMARRKHEETLKAAAREFASRTGKYEECMVEMKFVHDYSGVNKEWEEIVNGNDSQSTQSLISDDELRALKESLSGEVNPVCMKPVERERFIGIDQGIRTFSMVAIDKSRRCLPKVVGAAQVDLQSVGIFDRNGRFNATDVLLKLEEHTSLFDWIRGSCERENSIGGNLLTRVDRVVVVLEQMSIENAFSKQLGKELGTALQRQFDIRHCIVRLSQPHIHRANGPMFKLGEEIIEACSLEPPSYESLQTRVERKRQNNGDWSGGRGKRRREMVNDADSVEGSNGCVSSESDDESVNTVTNDNVYETVRRQVQNEEYRKKKAMSTAVFKYFMNATEAQQMAMQVEVEGEVQAEWRNRSDLKKLDDMGDALLHALDAVLCEGSRYRQLIASSPSLQKNRTVVLVVLPDKGFWISMECAWNQFVIEDMGVFVTEIANKTYSDERNVELIARRFHPHLLKAICEFDSSLSCLKNTSYIKVIVKQLKACDRVDMSSKAAGALTNSTVKAVTSIIDAACPNSTLTVCNNKKTGWRYTRTCRDTGKKMEVLRSSGKHLNAILSCLQWMKENMPEFVRDRPMTVNGEGRLKFFGALREIAFATPSGDEETVRLGNIQLSSDVKEKLMYREGISSEATKKTVADLILIGLDNNQQYISAISNNYRKGGKKQKTRPKSKPNALRERSKTESTSDGVVCEQSATEICTCNSFVVCRASKHLSVQLRVL